MRQEHDQLGFDFDGIDGDRDAFKVRPGQEFRLSFQIGSAILRIQVLDRPASGESMLYAQEASPLVTRNDLAERDFLRVWIAEGPHPCSARELLEAALKQPGPLLDVAAALVGGVAKLNIRTLGYRLRSMARRSYEGLRVARLGRSNRGILWGMTR